MANLSEIIGFFSHSNFEIVLLKVQRFKQSGFSSWIKRRQLLDEIEVLKNRDISSLISPDLLMKDFPIFLSKNFQSSTKEGKFMDWSNQKLH